jgi:uncharacterized protein (TIGR02646 family)
MRLEEPGVLGENKAKWRAVYIEKRKKDPKCRPSKAQYGHKKIVEALEAMSFHKCFYCERSTRSGGGEVDHYIELAERPDLAFEWSNLYLACAGSNGCNQKKASNTSIPVTSCVNPCDPAESPADHLTFYDEMIRPKDGSPKGLETIRKYQLNREPICYNRVKHLRRFDSELRLIHERMIKEGRSHPTEEEKEQLRAFAQPDQPFSLMFAVHLREVELLSSPAPQP